jgi:hypothetical protein
MQDGTNLPGEEAGEWLKEHKPEVSIRWEAGDEQDQDAYRRLLKLLFAPRSGSEAA